MTRYSAGETCSFIACSYRFGIVRAAPEPQPQGECESDREDPIRFWILRLGSVQVLDFRLSEQQSETCFEEITFTRLLPPNRKSAIENLKMSSYDPIRPLKHAGWNCQTDLLCRL